VKQYEIINPSNPCTIEANDDIVAGVAMMAVGSGQLGLADEAGNCIIPLLMFGGFIRWLVDVGIAKPEHDEAEAGAALKAYVLDHKLAIADVLDTCMYGSFADRKAYNRGLDMILGTVAKTKWRDDWATDRRSSVNDICAACWATAKTLREGMSDDAVPN